MFHDVTSLGLVDKQQIRAQTVSSLSVDILLHSWMVWMTLIWNAAQRATKLFSFSEIRGCLHSAAHSSLSRSFPGQLQLKSPCQTPNIGHWQMVFHDLGGNVYNRVGALPKLLQHLSVMKWLDNCWQFSLCSRTCALRICLIRPGLKTWKYIEQ